MAPSPVPPVNGRISPFDAILGTAAEISSDASGTCERMQVAVDNLLGYVPATVAPCAPESEPECTVDKLRKELRRIQNALESINGNIERL